MRLITILIALAISLFGQTPTWTAESPGGYSLDANGFYNKLLWDTAKHEMLYYGHPSTVSSIYSSALVAYSTTTHNWTLRVDNGVTAQHCAQEGSPYDTLNPLDGHPQGYFWYDSGVNKAFMTGQLCQSQFMGYTNVYVSGSTSMGTRIAHAPFGTGDGTFNASLTNFQNIDYISNYGKAIYCCYSGAGSNLKVVEFDSGSSTYTDVTSSVTGTTPPMPLTGMATMSDGTNLWVLAGCNGTAPGNFSPNNCSGTQLNDLYKYNPSTKIFTKITPVGSKPPSTNASFPFAYYDSLRGNIVWYAGTNDVWTYNIAGNAWTEYTTTGGFTIPSSGSVGPDGNMAQYDPVNDVGVFIYPVSGGGSAPLVYQLNFPTITYSTVLTVQEALSRGYSGSTRTNEPLQMGVALPDTAGITGCNQLQVSTGASVYQFTTPSTTWPSGNARFCKASVVIPSLAGGSTTTFTVANGGTGASGGSNLATNNKNCAGGTDATRIAINTGTSCFEIKKANFNLFDIVKVGATTVTATGTSNGFVLYGPSPTATYPGNVTCSPTSGGTNCSVASGTLYSSANDSTSTATIMENGPAAAMVEATWHYNDGASHTYMNGTAYIYFYVNKNYVRIVPVLRNADYGGSSAAALNAYHGLQGYEIQVGLNQASGNVTVANHTGTPTTGSISSASDVISIYQGQNTTMVAEETALPWTSDIGYTIHKNGGTSGLTGTTSGTAAQTPEGWADIDSSGQGVTIGEFWFGPETDKSLDFVTTGTVVTAKIGILSPHNSAPVYIEYPSYLIEVPHGVWMEFHTSSIASPSTDFNQFQSYLIARQTVTDYNTATVFPYPLISASTQDAFETNNFTNAVPATIPGGNAFATSNVTNSTPTACNGTVTCPSTTKAFSWELENDYRFDYLMEWIQRGWAPRWLEAMSWYSYYLEYGLPHSDGFKWPDHASDTDNFGFPTVTTSQLNANAALGIHGSGACCTFSGFTNYFNQEHAHRWGTRFYCELSGEQVCQDAYVNEEKNWYLSLHTYEDGGSPSSDTVTLVSGNSTVTATGGQTYTSTIIGQTLMVGTSPALAPYKVISLTDSTHVVVTPTPTVNLTNAQVVYSARALFNTRSAASDILSGTQFAQYLQSISDSSYTQVQQQIGHVFYEMVDSDLCASGYPSGCSFGVVDGNLGSQATIAGVNPKRGFQWGGAGQSGNWCAYTHAYRVNSAFQSGLIAQALMQLAGMMGKSWAGYYDAVDRAYGVAKFGQSELLIWDGTVNWFNNGFRFGFGLDVKNNCQDSTDLFTVSTAGTTAVTNIGAKSFAPICVASGTPCTSSSGMNPTVGQTPQLANLMFMNGTAYSGASVTDANHLTLNSTAPTNASQSMYIEEFDFQTQTNTYNYNFLFAADWATSGSIAWANAFQAVMSLMMDINGTSGRNVLGHEWTYLENIVNNPGSATLQTLTPTVVENSGCAAGQGAGHYCVTWTTPAGTQYLRAKWDPLAIVDWIGFNPSTNAFTGTPATNTAWFAASDVTPSAPAPVTGSQNMTINTGVTGLSASNFSIKAFTTGSAPPVTGGSVTNGNTKITGQVIQK